MLFPFMKAQTLAAGGPAAAREARVLRRVEVVYPCGETSG